jgi:hypothetical protein
MVFGSIEEEASELFLQSNSSCSGSCIPKASEEMKEKFCYKKISDKIINILR